MLNGWSCITSACPRPKSNKHICIWAPRSWPLYASDISMAIKPVTNKRFLNHAAASSADSVQVSWNIRLALTGPDFNMYKKSNSGNKANIQGVLGDHFAWANLNHESVEEVSAGVQNYRCMKTIGKAQEFARDLATKPEDVQAGTSVHIWLSFPEFCSLEQGWNDVIILCFRW